MCLFQALFACISIRAALIRLYHTPHTPTHTPPPQPTRATLFLYSMFYTVYRNTLYCLQYRCTVSHARGTEGQSVIYFPPHKKKLFQQKVVAIRHRLRGETSAHAHRDIVGAAHSDSLLSGALSGGCAVRPHPRMARKCNVQQRVPGKRMSRVSSLLYSVSEAHQKRDIPPPL